jgi:hypothetical protein
MCVHARVCMHVCSLLTFSTGTCFALNRINSLEGYSGLPTILLLFGLFLLCFMTKSKSTFDSVAYCSFKICSYFIAL